MFYPHFSNPKLLEGGDYDILSSLRPLLKSSIAQGYLLNSQESDRDQRRQKSKSTFEETKEGEEQQSLLKFKSKSPFGKCFLICSCLAGTARWHHLKISAMTEQNMRDCLILAVLKKKNVFLNSLLQVRAVSPSPALKVRRRSSARSKSPEVKYQVVNTPQ